MENGTVYLNEIINFNFGSQKFAHGFLSLKIIQKYNIKLMNTGIKTERSLKWDDEEIKIEWPLKIDKEYLKIITNEKDA